MKTLQTTLILDTVTAPVAAVVKAARVRKPKAAVVEAPAVVEVVAEVAAPVVAKVVTAAKPKAAPKAKAGKATKGAPKAPAGLNFTLMNRPSSGALLFAFTDAVLTESGLAKGAAVAKAALIKAMGATAVRYHADKGTFVSDDKGGIKLSAGGHAFFALRQGKFDPAVSAAYSVLITSGVADPLVCKNKDLIAKIA